MNKHFEELCTPAKLYFILAVISCLIALLKGVNFMNVAINLIIAFIWTIILGWICGKGFTGVSWFLVLFPYIIMLLLLFGLTKQISNHKMMMPSTTHQ